MVTCDSQLPQSLKYKHETNIKRMKGINLLSVICTIIILTACTENKKESSFQINGSGYFVYHGTDVMAFNDFYPEGHQGGITIIHHGQRIIANGDVRLEPTPGQWQPTPMLIDRIVDSAANTITCRLAFPDSNKIGKGVNPVEYPDLRLNYTVRTEGAGKSVKITIDLEKELPEEWNGQVGFNLELFPGDLFGKSYSIDGNTGMFPRQLDGPFYKDVYGDFQDVPLAEGKKLTIMPEDRSQMLTIESLGNKLRLLDGRAQHNNGWFIVRADLKAGTRKHAVELMITPADDEAWKYPPVIHVSQLGYLPSQHKTAIIETDAGQTNQGIISLVKVNGDGTTQTVRNDTPAAWGKYLRYQYYLYDFSNVTDEGTYYFTYGGTESNLFRIDRGIYKRHAWQPVIEYFLPVQMCHMRINDRYKVWHGLCHMDDALMAPVNHIHFDGYFQGPSTLTSYKPMQHVPGINAGGWHDAGDYDLRVESQAGTVYKLALILEEFKPEIDMTSIDQQHKIVEMNKPDGIQDILQQIEHGVLSIVGGYKSMGRLYRGIISSTLRQYVLLGDGSTMTDNVAGSPATPDDRWVFTEQNPRRELGVAASLAAASTALKEYNKPLSDDCMAIALKLYSLNADSAGNRIYPERIRAITEIYRATGNKEYLTLLKKNLDHIVDHFDRAGWVIGRVPEILNDQEFSDRISPAVQKFRAKLDTMNHSNPFGVPYKPYIWGAGWIIQELGVEEYFLHKAWPDQFGDQGYLNALNFVLGCHPGSNSASFASGIGTKSVEVAYGANRDDWSYIPGGVVSGTALIRPDFPELKTWPYLWQQTEYVLGGGATDFMFLVLAADHTQKE